MWAGNKLNVNLWIVGGKELAMLSADLSEIFSSESECEVNRTFIDSCRLLRFSKDFVEKSTNAIV